MKHLFHDRIAAVHEIEISADDLIDALLSISAAEHVSILDSCGVGYLGSHLLIAGIEPIRTVEISNPNSDKTLAHLDEQTKQNFASIFTLSYDFGAKLIGTTTVENTDEPDLFLACFDVLIIHDYDTDKTTLTGNPEKFDQIQKKLKANISNLKFQISNYPLTLNSNFSNEQYLQAIEEIQEQIRRGNTYQTNLTQQFTAVLPDGTNAAAVFSRLRLDHPAPFSAFIRRLDSTVVSASPERFFKVENGRMITTSPIKGTRKRGSSPDEDAKFRADLLASAKDRAENTMIVDLLRNDLGRVCEYGSVRVEKLCDLETHPTFFHLISTISGELRENTRLSDILTALFPCGSITGAPKINTMQIINEIEPAKRGLSMGAIGLCIPKGYAVIPETLDLSVAIRTMVVRDRVATFNVGGGITIDSDPESEYAESLLKAKALIDALGGRAMEQNPPIGF